MNRALIASAAYSGVVGGGAAALCDVLGWRSWALFLVWTAYALFGGRWRSGLKMYASFVAGIACGSLVRLTEDALAPLGPLAPALAVGTAIFLLSLLADDPPLSDVPAYFLGAIAVFATGHPPSLGLALSLILPGAAGLSVGWVTTRGGAVITTRLAPDRPS